MIELRHITKTFPLAVTAVVEEDSAAAAAAATASTESAPATFDALRDVNLTINDGDIYGIIGMSGAGKSTLVRCINMLERPTVGQVIIDGTDMGALSEKELRRMRRDITMIFQGFNLLMQRTCLANVCFPLELSGMKHADAKRRAMELLDTVGLPDKANAYPAQLSGGQQQRIAIARALATQPKVLLCDEATSALDPNTTHAILELIRQINRELGITVIIITHQMSVVESVCNRVAILDRGVVVEEGSVADIFANPQSDAAKRLVYPETADKSGKPSDDEERFRRVGHTGERVLRVVFNGSRTADKPLITSMAVDTGITANILYASTRIIEERVTGTILLGIPDSDDTFQTAYAYLTSDPAITVTEISQEHLKGGGA